MVELNLNSHITNWMLSKYINFSFNVTISTCRCCHYTSFRLSFFSLYVSKQKKNDNQRENSKQNIFARASRVKPTKKINVDMTCVLLCTSKIIFFRLPIRNSIAFIKHISDKIALWEEKWKTITKWMIM